MPKTKEKRSKDQSYIPYVRGFSPPTDLKKNRALGADPGTEFSTGENFFPPLPKCTSEDDWLAQYKPEKQTFNDFIRENPWLATQPRKNSRAPQKLSFNPSGSTLQEKYPGGAIYLMQLGTFNDDDPDFDALMEYTRQFLCLPVKKLIIPDAGLVFEQTNVYWQYHIQVKGQLKQRRIKIHSRFNKKTGRYQLNAVSCNDILQRILPDDAWCLVALTMSDLFVDNTDLFIAGQAGGNYQAATFSLFRYNPNIEFSNEFWHEVTESNKYVQTEQKKIMLLRSCRLAVHEIMHLLGVDHCIFYACCMNGSGHLAEDFQQPMFLCPIDLRKIQVLSNFNVSDRYRGLRDFFVKHGMTDEAQWCDRRIKFLQSYSQD